MGTEVKISGAELALLQVLPPELAKLAEMPPDVREHIVHGWLTKNKDRAHHFIEDMVPVLATLSRMDEQSEELINQMESDPFIAMAMNILMAGFTRLTTLVTSSPEASEGIEMIVAGLKKVLAVAEKEYTSDDLTTHLREVPPPE